MQVALKCLCDFIQLITNLDMLRAYLFTFTAFHALVGRLLARSGNIKHDLMLCTRFIIVKRIQIHRIE